MSLLAKPENGKLINSALKIKFCAFEDENEFIAQFKELEKKMKEIAKEVREDKIDQKLKNNQKLQRKITIIRIKGLKKQ